jgi:hypothetical protein
MSNSFVGRWDVTVLREGDPFPAWFEIFESADGLTGRYVGIWGSARPISSVRVDGSQISFSLPPQYEGSKKDLVFEGVLAVSEDGIPTIRGGHSCWNPDEFRFEAKPAPELPNRSVSDGQTINLLANGTDGFTARWASHANHWSMKEGVLVNAEKGTDLVSVQKFQDFRLVAEYQYPEGSNSGIYLRGRYEVQILDDFGQEPTVSTSAAVYGFLCPHENAIQPHGEWNRAEITLVGRYVKIILNGKTVIDSEIPGITGGAVDSSEGEVGPILLQGDHGPVSFRKLEITELI